MRSTEHGRKPRAAGARAFFQNDSGLKPFPTDFINAGYMLGDEVDMTDSGACSSRTWQARKNNFPSDGRLFYANFGKGVMFWQSNAGAACWVNSVNIPSVDVYWFTDGNACGSGEGGGDPGVYMQNNCHNAVNYGYNVNRVRSLLSVPGSKPIWNFVEIGCPWTGTWGCITHGADAGCHLALLHRRGQVGDLLRPLLQGRRRQRYVWLHVGHAA